MRKPIKREDRFFVYIVQCAHGTYYTGYTNNLERRLEQHDSGKGGAKYLKGKGPISLVYAKKYRYYKSALNAEREIKTYTRKEKEELIRVYEKDK
ncbi:MAG: GIY-YIG nuclease family protein [Elusimicrobia bacterium]|nr:GIY-YIG nuclease family protein [Elusimicrobiota bacterium]